MRMLAAYGIRPDMVMGHSVGEYGALVAAGAFPFEDALEAVSARGREMTRVSMADNGKMAAVFAPIAEVERLLKTIDGYVVLANVNSNSQSVIGGGTKAVEQAEQMFLAAGFNVVELPVSHAFHTSIVAPASEPLKEDAAAAASADACYADHLQCHRRILSDRTRCRRADTRHAGPAGCRTGAVRQRPAHSL